MREYLRNVYRRRIDSRHRCWAGEWWRYDEAVIRLEALWRAWEHLRQDPATGMSVWWRDHADHHMPALMAPDGPFAPPVKAKQTGVSMVTRYYTHHLRKDCSRTHGNARADHTSDDLGRAGER